MKDLGKITTCMVRELTLGVMAENMKENTTWIKSMVMVFTTGQMGVDMKDIGKMVSNMAKVNIFFPML